MQIEKDEATRKYEREIRLGMSLLGVLALVFIGVLARRIWVENRQLTATTKRPIYLTKQEREALRSRSKPLPVVATNSVSQYENDPSSTPAKLKRLAPRLATDPKKSAVRATKPNEVPDLAIEEVDPPAGSSQPTSFHQPDSTSQGEEPPTKAREPETLPKPTTAPRPVPAATSAQDDSDVSEAEPETDPTEEEIDRGVGGVGVRTEDEQLAPSESIPPKPASRFSAAPTKEAAEPESHSTAEPAPAPLASSPPAAQAEEKAEPIRKSATANPWKRTEKSDPKRSDYIYTTRRGDSLKSIAKQILGDESKWKEIYDLNRDEIGDDYGYLRSGVKLHLPFDADEPPANADPEAMGAKIAAPR